ADDPFGQGGHPARPPSGRPVLSGEGARPEALRRGGSPVPGPERRLRADRQGGAPPRGCRAHVHHRTGVIDAPPTARGSRRRVRRDGFCGISIPTGASRRPGHRSGRPEGGGPAGDGRIARLLAAGRTDAGVHALGQVVAFDTTSSIPGDRFAPALNRHLPDGVVVRRSWEAEASFHPQYGAVSKEYRYLLLTRKEPTALARHRAWWVPRELDLEAMREAAAGLTGRHDFAAFASTGSSARSTVRTVYRLDLLPQPPWLVVAVEGDGFLYRMVRRLVAGLVEVGRGRMAPADLTRRL